MFDGVPLPLLTGLHVLGSSERKICRLFFLEEVPPAFNRIARAQDSPFQKTRLFGKYSITYGR